MIDLCDQVKAYNRGLREQVCVSADDWQGLAYVQPDECPAHWPTAA
jgi:hypothetical protein